MLIFETSGRFPFRTMRLLGWTLITLGFVLLVLDITDVAYTAANFGDDDCEAADYPGWDESPCKHDDHIYCYIASGIWSSIVIIITGIMGARFSKWNIRHLRFQRDLFAVMAVLCALLFVPAVLALHAVEMVKLKDMGAFYYEDGDLKTRDEAKFALPMVILMIASLIFLVAAMTAIISCCCAPVNDYDDGYGRGRGLFGSYAKPAYYGDPYGKPPMRRPSMMYGAPERQPRRPSIGTYGPPVYPQPLVTDPLPRALPAPVYTLPRPSVAQPVYGTYGGY